MAVWLQCAGVGMYCCKNSKSKGAIVASVLVIDYCGYVDRLLVVVVIVVVMLLLLL